MRYLLTWLLVALGLPCTAQQTITGRVLDAATKEPLAFVPFVIEGARAGTTSDIDGRFALAVPHLPVTLKASYAGYEPQLITLADAAPQ